MPWHVVKSSKCPPSKPWAVVKDADGSISGCHPTKEKAQAQMAALYANEPGVKMSATLADYADVVNQHQRDPCGCQERDHETRAVDNSAWDGGAAMSHCADSDSPGSCYAAICAGRKKGEAALQSSWALPHHKRPGSPPNAAGVRNSLSRLPQTQGLTNSSAARSHLEAHMKSIHAQADAAVPKEVRDRRAAAFAQQPTVPAGAARSVAFPSLLEIRKVERDGGDVFQLHGTANTYEQPYEMWDVFGPYKEIVAAGAGKASLAANPDVAFLVNHKGMAMARTTNGTLELREEPDGLHYDAYLNPKRQDIRDLYAAIEDRTITESSFAFMITDGSWNDDFTEYRIGSYNIDRGDVSAVNYGANPYTSVGARSREILADLERLPAGAARAALQRLQDRPDPTVEEPRGRSVALEVQLLRLDEES